MKNKYLKNAKFSDAKFRDILRLFCIDLEAKQISLITKLNRETSTALLTFSSAATYIGAGCTVFVVSEIARGSLFTGLGLAIGVPLSFILFGLIAPKIRSFGRTFNAVTISDFFEKRFGVANRRLMSILQLVFIALTIGMQVVAVSWLISFVLGSSYLLSEVILFIFSMGYSAIGGIKADILTDTIQFWIMTALFVVLSVFIYISPDFMTNITTAVESISNPLNNDTIGVFLLLLSVMAVGLIAYPTNWQLALSAKNEKSIQRSCWWAAGITFVIQMFVIFFGLYAFSTLSGIENYDLSLFNLIQNTMPKWMAGFGLSAILAISMSSLDSMFVAGSAIISGEFIKRRTSKKVWETRGITLLFGGLSFLLALLFPSIATLGYFSITWGLIPVAITLIGMYGIRLSSTAAFCSLLMPMVATLIIYPILGFQSVWIIPLLSLVIILGYDRVIKKS
ncbi:MAG: sodium:solute symporter family protein [Rickettsiales bacterium]|jgi:SSS family solute:Na+ symporter|nr:sodium:solute symporter family protein [Rickettsiales bacterium]